MSKRTIVFTIISLFLITSCSNQPNSLNTSPSLAMRTVTPMIVLTKPPSSANSILITPTVTPYSEIKLAGNELIAFSVLNTRDLSIYTLSPSKGVMKRLVGTEQIMYYNSPSWSPSGEQVVFTANNTKGSKVYIVDQDGNNLHLLRNEKGIEQFDPAWSPDGEHIAYTTTLDLYVTNVEGKGLQHLATLAGLEFPAWSPDGKRLAFIADPTKGNNKPYVIYLVDNDGNNLQPISKAIAGWGHLSWSPDGSKIAFRSFENCGDINIIDVKTGEITNLTNTPDAVEQDPAWSADGNFIAFSKSLNFFCDPDRLQPLYSEDLFIMTSKGQDVTQLTVSKGANEPSWWPTVVLQPNWKYSVTKAGFSLNVRETPTTSAKSLDKLPQGAIFTALDGPQDADGYSWWHIRTEDGIEGWMVDMPGWYMFESATTPSS